MKRLFIVEVLIVGLLVGVSLLVSLSWMGRVLDLKIQDALVWFRPARVTNLFIYVAIDDATIDQMKVYPLPRVALASAVEVLKEFSSRAVIIDSEFIDPAPLWVDREKYEAGFQRLEDVVVNQDMRFGEALAKEGSPVYLACRGVFDSDKERTQWSETNAELQMVYERFFVAISNSRGMENFFDERAMEFPVFPLYMYAAGLGDTTSDESQDGILRQVALLRHFHGRYVPQLSFAYALDALSIDKEKIVREGEFLILPSREGKRYRVPINQQGEMLVHWVGTWKTQPWTNMISLVDLLRYQEWKRYSESLQSSSDAHAREEALSVLRSYENLFQTLLGKVVIIGYTASSTTDVGAIPFDTLAPRVMLQAHLLNTLFTESFLLFPDWRLDGIFIGILLVVLVLVSQWAKSALQEVGILGLNWGVLVAWMVGNMLLFGRHTHAFFLLTVGLLISVFYIVYKFILFDKQKQFIKQAFSYYLSPVVIRQLLSDPSQLQLGGEQREITAFFSDVEGFTSISEQLSPSEVVSLLNEYLTVATDVLLKYGGTVDKFEGDAIVAFFGAPVTQSDHSYRCCMAALEMQLKLKVLSLSWVEQGYPLLKTRIGMNSGLAVVGNMGSRQRMNYTMMGDTVNLASRLEGANKFYGTYTMISESTYEQVKDAFVCRKLDLIRVKGKTHPIAVYELVERVGKLTDEKQAILVEFDKARELYEKRQWEEASERFRHLWENYGDPPSQTYLNRCEEFTKNSPLRIGMVSMFSNQNKQLTKGKTMI